jgi:hypothetical protein
MRQPAVSRYLSSACALVVVALTQLASAETAEETAGVTKFEDGKKAYQTGQFEAALAAFQESLVLLPSPNTRLYIGRCFRALSKPASAYTAFRQAAREASDRVRATDEKRYKATVETATTEAAELEGKVPRLTVALPTDAPEGTVVRVGDRELPRAGWQTPIETDPGHYRVSATGPRRRPFTREVDLREGEQARVEVALAQVPTALIALRFVTRPSGLAVQLDGVPLDPAEWSRALEVDTGSHTLSAHAPGYEDFVWTNVVRDTERTDVNISLVSLQLPAADTQGTPKWFFFGVAGLSVAAFGTASILAVEAKPNRTSRRPWMRCNETRTLEIRCAACRRTQIFCTSRAARSRRALECCSSRLTGSPKHPTRRPRPWFLHSPPAKAAD